MDEQRREHQPNNPEELLTVAEVIAELRVPRSTFYRWRQRGIAPRAVKLPNGGVRIPRGALRDWLRAHTDTSDTADTSGPEREETT